MFRLETGIIFNSLALDQTGRLNALWEEIAAPALSHLDVLTIPTDGVMINFLYNYKPYQDREELARTLDDIGTPEEAKFYLPAEGLQAYLSKALGEALSAQELIDRSTVTVNGAPVRLLLSTTSTDRQGNGNTPDS